jgi:hypothetical protein
MTVTHQANTQFLPRVAVAAFIAIASLSGAGTVLAHTAAVTVTSNPTSVSVSPPGRPAFYVEYAVSVTNQSSRNAYDYDFKGKTLVSGAAAPVPTATFYSSTGVSCSVPNPADPTVIACAKTKIGPNQTKIFKITFKTPSAGTNLLFTLTALSGGVKYGEGFANTELITLLNEQSIVSFNTNVPTSGGTFFTGFKGAGANPPLGGVATTEDPWTTTVVVPGIVNATTANAAETIPTGGAIPPLSVCPPGNLTYRNCFSTALTIPNLSYPAGSGTPYLTIYLRIDYLQIGVLADIATAKVWYEKTPGSAVYLEVPPCGPAGPSTGVPCIANRKIYPYNDPNFDFQNDWEFEIHATDNGRYIN